MKRTLVWALLLTLSVFILAQEIQHDAVAINIEVPVRVFRGNQFIDNLTLQDFEIYEDGVLQKIEAVYLIRKTDIAREEAASAAEEAGRAFSPQVARHFVLVFELTEYLPKVKDAMDYFIRDILVPEDTLMVVTPVTSYKFKQESFANLSRDQIIERMNDRLKTDITLGTREYKNLIRDYMQIYDSDYEGDVKLALMKDKIRELKALRYLHENTFQEFADHLKNLEGQKNVFFFYQTEQLPIPELPPEYMEGQDFWSELQSFHAFDIDKVKNAYADSSITIHFLYLTTPPSHVDIHQVERRSAMRDMQIADANIEFFSVFQTMAKTTGGLTESSANPAAAFKKAADASENYYILYYTPKDYKPDGKFREIKVKVIGKNYRITHRAGYIAD